MRFLAVIAALGALAGCGYVGDPLPPALKIPRPVEDVAVRQVGSFLTVSFTLPKETMEGLELRDLGRVELLVTDTWPAGGQTVEVPPGASSAKLPVAGFAGKEVAVAVRTANAKGRFSPWSSPVRWNVESPVATPENLRAESTAAGVKVTWYAPSGTEWRVYRLASVGGSVDKERVEIGKTREKQFVDAGIEYGGNYRYTVEGVAGQAVSELSETVEIVPVDRFAPTAPQGLAAINGAAAVQLSWERNTEPDVAHYRIYRAVAEGEFSLLHDKHTTATYADAQVRSGQRFRYAVSAVDRAGNESAQSNSVEVQVP